MKSQPQLRNDKYIMMKHLFTVTMNRRGVNRRIVNSNLSDIKIKSSSEGKLSPLLLLRSVYMVGHEASLAMTVTSIFHLLSPIVYKAFDGHYSDCIFVLVPQGPKKLRNI